jgi:hypothetical protein
MSYRCGSRTAPQQSGAATPSSSSTLMGLAALATSVTWFEGGCNVRVELCDKIYAVLCPQDVWDESLP